MLLRDGARYRSAGRLWLMAFVVSLSSFYFGYTMVYLGTLHIQFVKKYYNCQGECLDKSDDVLSGVLNGVVPMGAMFGSLIFGSYTIGNVSRKYPPCDLGSASSL